MIYFLFFFLGMLMMALVLPILSSLQVVLEQKLELKKAKIALEVHKINKELGDDQEEISTNVIGFNLDPKVEQEEDEYEDN